jgi:hypothetical protein
MLKIGVRLPCPVDDIGEHLADVRALEAAGVDSIWLDRRGGPTSGQDPWMVLAAAAVITGRVRLGTSLVPADLRAADVLSQRLVTLQHLSRGRGMVRMEFASPSEPVEECIALVRRACGDGLPVLLDAVDEMRNGSQAAFQRVLAVRQRQGATTPPELWAEVAEPDSRASWKEVRRACEEKGATGVIVPFGPRLLDLLRRPDEEDDRSDLFVAQG